MLDSLRSIVQEVNAANDLQMVLDIIVYRVREVMGTEVCSVYLRDHETGRYIFMATEGLNKSSVGKASLGEDEGLVGQVARREEPINLRDAANHPKFMFVPGIGEESYSSFLGVPIIHQRQVLGVLIVQQRELRRFDESEEAFLVTMSAQLAGVIAHAQATGAIQGIGAKDQVVNAKFKGVPGSPGIAIGKAVVVTPPAQLSKIANKSCDDVEGESAFFLSALAKVRADIKAVGTKLETRLAPEEQALFDVYLHMLDDSALGAEVVELIKAEKLSAQKALSNVVLSHVKTFEEMGDAYLSERAADVRDLGSRVLGVLQDEEKAELVFPENTILVGEELTASILGEVPRDRLVGMVSVQGSANSHLAILARAMGIPTVMGATDLPYDKIQGADLILDGYSGEVFFNPASELIDQFEAVRDEELELSRELETFNDLPCETIDKHRVPLLVNTGLMADVALSLKRGAEGIGLYRTEVPFLLRDRFPSEEEQRVIYREQLKAFAPRSVIMRTLDVGGDKALPYFPIEEANPFLGWRGIRVTLDHPEIFLVQVRAMLKASEGYDNLRILLPMVTSTSELDDALVLIERAYNELIEEGVALFRPRIGVMIEVPAAVYQARMFARRVDFLSIGSNDLTQYLLAVDRNNARVADIYDAYHPAVLQALRNVAEAAHAEGKHVSICGEMAGDPGAAILLLAMGYDSLSMNAISLPKIKLTLRAIRFDQATEILNNVMVLDCSKKISSYLYHELSQLGLSRLLRPVNRH